MGRICRFLDNGQNTHPQKKKKKKMHKQEDNIEKLILTGEIRLIKKIYIKKIATHSIVTAVL